MTDDSSLQELSSPSDFWSCLPPRKRLVAGLKLINRRLSWSPACAVGLHTVEAPCESLLQDSKVRVELYETKNSTNVPCETQQQAHKGDEIEVEAADPDNHCPDHTVPNPRKRVRDGEAGVASILKTSIAAMASDQQVIDHGHSQCYEKDAKAAKTKAVTAADEARAKALDKATVATKAAHVARAALDGALKEDREVQQRPHENGIKVDANKALLVDGGGELAPQIHCAINESPWVYCNLIPSPPPSSKVGSPARWHTMSPDLKEVEIDKADNIKQLSEIFRSKRNNTADRTSSLLPTSNCR